MNDIRLERKKQLTENLGHFHGTEEWYELYKKPKILCTDGMKFVMETAQAYWLSEIVFSLQSNSVIKKQYFQVYELEVNLEKKEGVLVVTDGNENELYKQEFEYTDFPLEKFRFYFTDGVLLLPSEY